MNRAVEVSCEPVMADTEVLPLLGFRSKRSLDRLRERGMYPAGVLQAVARNKFRRVVPTAEVHDAIARLRMDQLPAARREHFRVGRRLAGELRREKRDLAFLGKRVLVELGAAELAAVLKPIHPGPLKEIRRGHGSLIRVALRSALHRAGKDAP